MASRALYSVSDKVFLHAFCQSITCLQHLLSESLAELPLIFPLKETLSTFHEPNNMI